MTSTPLRWVGSKRRLTDVLLSLAPTAFDVYVEPFAGGASMLFALPDNPDVSVYLGDLNASLVAFYSVLSTGPVGAELIALELQGVKNTLDSFLAMRAKNPWVPIPPTKLNAYSSFASACVIAAAARLYAINRMCFNGLWRENSKGELNTTFGYRSCEVVDLPALLAASEKLQCHNAVALHADAIVVLEHALVSNPGKSLFAYLDPPYTAETDSAFQAYTPTKFGLTGYGKLCADLKRLASEHPNLTWMVSSADDPHVRAAFDGFRIVELEAYRSVGASASSRGRVTEIAIMNYG